MKIKFAERLREARLYKNISQTALAKAMETSQINISRWENNVSETDFLTLAKLAKTLEVSTDYLLGLTDNY